jgi:hypothetical protein
MNDLNRALGDITSIRRQVARTTEFRGYGPATLAATGLFAVIAALVQMQWLPDPPRHITAYIAIWSATAILSASLIGLEMAQRAQRIHSGIADEMIHMAVVQFLPSAAAGALLTIVILRAAPSVLWMLPGLLQIVFSLGVFASCRSLPRSIAIAGAWYLLTGLACIAIGDTHALSPFAMGVPFGAGQLLIAALLQSAAKEAR